MRSQNCRLKLDPMLRTPRHFKPGVKALIDGCHSRGLPVIYLGCGNVNRIFEDFIELGVDLRCRSSYRIGFYGNMDVMMSDHSVPGDVPAANYEYAVPLVRRHGGYPLQSEAFDLPGFGLEEQA